jgi:hypothetical protein
VVAPTHSFCRPPGAHPASAVPRSVWPATAPQHRRGRAAARPRQLARPPSQRHGPPPAPAPPSPPGPAVADRSPSAPPPAPARHPGGRPRPPWPLAPASPSGARHVLSPPGAAGGRTPRDRGAAAACARRAWARRSAGARARAGPRPAPDTVPMPCGSPRGRGPAPQRFSPRALAGSGSGRRLRSPRWPANPMPPGRGGGPQPPVALDAEPAPGAPERYDGGAV